jgi:purine-binding chemotaxis protein CheW
VASAAGQLLSFRIANERFALPASAVREIVRPGKTTRVPHAPDSVVGLANLRGRVMPILALGALLDRQVAGGGRVIVLERADPVGLLVDDVSAVIVDAASGALLIDPEALLAKAFSGRTSPSRSTRIGTVISPEATTAAVEEIALLAFAVASQEYALPIDQVEEVMRFPAGIVPMPLSDAVVLGTVARRGRLLPLLSLRLLLGLGTDVKITRQQLLVVQIGDHQVGLAVDSVRSILRVPEREIDPIPAVLARGQSEARIQGICRLDGGRRLVSILAVDHLLRADLTARLLEGSSNEGDAMASSSEETETEQFLIFNVGEQEFGMPIEAVREVTRLPDKLARLPKAPAFVEGMMNLRGKVIPVIDQGRRFDDTPVEGKRRRVIIATLGKSEAGFLVDSVSDVLRIASNAIGPAPDLGDERTRVFDRVANLETAGRVILIVEPQELLDRAERDLLAAMTLKGGNPAS